MKEELTHGDSALSIVSSRPIRQIRHDGRVQVEQTVSDQHHRRGGRPDDLGDRRHVPDRRRGDGPAATVRELPECLERYELAVPSDRQRGSRSRRVGERGLDDRVDAREALGGHADGRGVSHGLILPEHPAIATVDDPGGDQRVVDRAGNDPRRRLRAVEAVADLGQRRNRDREPARDRLLTEQRPERRTLRDLAVAPRHQVAAHVRQRPHQVRARERKKHGRLAGRSFVHQSSQGLRQRLLAGAHGWRHVHAHDDPVSGGHRLGRGSVRRRIAALVQVHLPGPGHALQQALGERPARP